MQSQDFSLFQFVYSNDFEHAQDWGKSLASLLKTLATIFGTYINSVSLRHATLALAATCVQSSVSNKERAMYHSARAYKALQRQTTTTLGEADLYAALLLTLLATISENIKEYSIHLNGFQAVMLELKRKARETGYSLHLSIFWPLARDLIIEGSRNVGHSEDLVISFALACQQLVGRQSLLSRVHYFVEFYGEELGWEYAFVQSSWQYCRLLRMYFRETVYEQLEGAKGVNNRTKSLVSEMKADLSSSEVCDIVEKIASEMSDISSSNELDARSDVLRYMRLIYQFCQHLIVILEAPTVLEAVVSPETMLSAKMLIGLIQPEWSTPLTSSHYIFPRPTAPCLLPRLLWVAGLSLTKTRNIIGTPTVYRVVNLTTVAALGIKSLLHCSRHRETAAMLEQFWKTPSLDHIYDLLDIQIMVEVFPGEYHWISW